MMEPLLSRLSYSMHKVALPLDLDATERSVTRATPTDGGHELYFVFIPSFILKVPDDVNKGAAALLEYLFPSHARVFALSRELEAPDYAYVMMFKIWAKRGLDFTVLTWSHVKSASELNDPGRLAAMLDVEMQVPSEGPRVAIRGSKSSISEHELGQVRTRLWAMATSSIAQEPEEYLKNLVAELNFPNPWQQEVIKIPGSEEGVRQLVAWAVDKGKYPRSYKGTFSGSSAIGAIIEQVVRRSGADESGRFFRMILTHELLGPGRQDELVSDYGGD